MVVANSTPLIYLAALSDFDLLRDLYGTVIIPQAVFNEVVTQAIGFPVKAAVESALQGWLSIVLVRDPGRVNEIARTAFLDPGEAEAIVLAQEVDASSILLDDQAAVTFARKFGLHVTRTPLDALRGARITEAARWEDDEWELFAGPGADLPQEERRVAPLAILLESDSSLSPIMDLRIGTGIRRDEASEWRPWGGSDQADEHPQPEAGDASS